MYNLFYLVQFIQLQYLLLAGFIHFKIMDLMTHKTLCSSSTSNWYAMPKIKWYGDMPKLVM